MQFHKAELVISAPDRHSWPDSNLPEIVLAGRSNVGKSSFINAMTERKKLAYVGSTPGKTRLLNFFNLDDRYMLVDVPGYGYANLSKQQLLRFGEMMEDYFNERKQKKGAVILVDARHLPTEDDHTMLEYIRYFSLPIIIVATKIDKVPKTKRAHQLAVIRKDLQLQEGERLFAFSSATKEGSDEIWKAMIEIMEMK
ncbi:ribosome biogenesis GTP-binding protein YihA/YsxC [Merdibacter massiliensis]|uniref:ribosome biogenesis GTP-binding protein YihA/YsxC n=1 Tax=Merdibacter massiliensis TaxID=1871030 RepID=UPI00096A6435|nr:ribosome biogenesis GTP-binding protein YihA/YsxC [Merdibacter massiliensis]